MVESYHVDIGECFLDKWQVHGVVGQLLFGHDG